MELRLYDPGRKPFCREEGGYVRVSDIPRRKKLADRLPRPWKRKLTKLSSWVAAHIPLLLVGWYFYGMLINSVRLGIDSTFHSSGTPEVKSIWVMNPFRNFLAVFTPTGLGVTFFCVIMVCLITKKGYNWLSGYKFERDPRGFDIVAEGTHGTGGWWTKRTEIEKLIDIGPPATLEGVLIGKQGEESDEEYLAMILKGHRVL